MSKLRALSFGASLALLGACKNAPQTVNAPPGPPPSAQPEELATHYVSDHEVAKGSSFYNSLKSLGIDSPTILQIIDNAKDVFSLREIGAGTSYSVTWDDEQKTVPLSIDLKIAADSSLMIERKDASDLKWTATRINYPVTIQQKTFNGVVDSSLWESADLVGMDPSLITALSEVFAWQVDFSREVQRGDRWRLTVEQKLVNDQVIGWGNILVAEYENGSQTFTGIRFPQLGEHASYYGTNGQSLKQMFLKSPLKFGRVTSSFSKSRFHPVLKFSRPHNGVDYGAPIGTPIMSVGRGTVVAIGPHGGSGNMIKIQHNGTYATAYLHMKAFASGLRRGSSVEQGQVIGYVGATGLATGPHLHFSFYENGSYVDPLGRKFASADPVQKKDMPDFQKTVASVMDTLPDWHLAQHAPATTETMRNIVKSPVPTK